MANLCRAIFLSTPLITGSRLNSRANSFLPVSVLETNSQSPIPIPTSRTKIKTIWLFIKMPTEKTTLENVGSSLSPVMKASAMRGRAKATIMKSMKKDRPTRMKG